MDDVTLVVKQDVPVMSVLDLQEVGDDAVGRAALDEVSLSREELL